MGNFHLLERSGKHTLHFTASGHCGVGNHSHQTGVSATINEDDLALGE